MASERKTDFSQLYRAAFSERDPAIQQFLLRQVQAALDAWSHRSTALPVAGVAEQPAHSFPARGVSSSDESTPFPVARRA